MWTVIKSCIHKAIKVITEMFRLSTDFKGMDKATCLSIADIFRATAQKTKKLHMAASEIQNLKILKQTKYKKKNSRRLEILKQNVCVITLR